jgi:heat-inducible transcriptional repressor
MTDGLTSRQTQILKTIIDEYIETADPVGSDALDKKYSLGVSPATIRNEMVSLTKSGYLRQPHTSAGRIPTPTAMKFYINQLMDEKQMSLVDEVRAKEEVWDSRDDIDELMDEATHALADRTRSLTVSALRESGKGRKDRYWHAGHSYVFQNPEFSNLMVCRDLFSVLEEIDKMESLFFGINSTSPLEVLFGEELGVPGLAPTSIVSAHFNVRGKPGALSVIGPARTDYGSVIPILRYFGNLIEEVANA